MQVATSDDYRTSKAGCKLAINLFAQLDGDKDALISPLGVQLALAIVLAGSAAGETANQLLTGMGFSPELGREQALSAMAALVAVRSLFLSCSQHTFSFSTI
jgi:serine protease inhibitor